MHYDRDFGDGRRDMVRDRGEWWGRGEYGAAYEAPYRGGYHGFGMGYLGGALRSRGSYEAGQLRSGLNPVDEFEFEWGDGYVGGRGYGGTNYDLEHGYRVGGTPRYPAAPPTPERATSPATRGGYEWGEEFALETGQPYGPSRYGYGPYYERLRRRRRSDEEIRRDVEETLFYDTWVDADRITVEVEDGVVTLKGTLASYDEVRYATDDAWDVDGVRGVRSELRVEEPEAGKGEAEQRAEPEAEQRAEPEAGQRAAEKPEEGRAARAASRTGRRGAQARRGAKAEGGAKGGAKEGKR